MSNLHTFVALPETEATDQDITNQIIRFAQGGEVTSDDTKAPQAATPKASSPSIASPINSTQLEDTLNARLLATLKAHEHDPLEEQVKIMTSPPYDNLPVSHFLAGATAPLPAPLTEMVARFLDGEPLARKWAASYAQMQVARYRSSGWWPSESEAEENFNKLEDYAFPIYARSIYVQKSR